MDAGFLRGLIRDVADFPRPGVVFRDITPLLADPDAFRYAADAIADHFAGHPVDRVAGIEARGFLLAAPIAYRFGSGLVAVRKGGKLPGDVESEGYDLEYGSDHLEIARAAIQPGDRVLVVDDVLATGGTAATAATLVRRLGAEVVGFGFLVELAALGGREALGGSDSVALVRYE